MSEVLDRGYATVIVRLFLLLMVAESSLAESNGSSDSIPPSQVTDLTLRDLQADSTQVAFLLTWTAPGDDDHVGKAWRYEMRIACGALDDQAWPYAMSLTDELDVTGPKSASASESLLLKLSGLDPDTDYAIALKSVDEAGHFSPLSNVVTFHTSGKSRDFSEVIFLNGLDVWAWGHHMTGEHLVAKYSGCEFSLGGIVHPIKPVKRRTREHDDSWEQTLRAVPGIKALMDQGISFNEAKIAYYRDRERLVEEAQALLEADSVVAARSLLERSSLVDSACIQGGSLDVVFVGHPIPERLIHHHHEGHNPKPILDSSGASHVSIRVSGAKDARRFVDNLRYHTLFSSRTPSIALVSGHGISAFSGDGLVAQVRAQIAWLLETMTHKGMPEGPLHDPQISEILEANQ